MMHGWWRGVRPSQSCVAYDAVCTWRHWQTLSNWQSSSCDASSAQSPHLSPPASAHAQTTHTQRHTTHTETQTPRQTPLSILSLYVVTVTTKYSNQYEAQRVQTQRNQSSRTVLTADTHSTTPACSFTDSWGFSYITSHHIEKTDAGLDRPLYLRNKLYDKTLKSQNYYSNILRFAVPGDLPYGNTIPLVSLKLI